MRRSDYQEGFVKGCRFGTVALDRGVNMQLLCDRTDDELWELLKDHCPPDEGNEADKSMLTLADQKQDQRAPGRPRKG